MSKSKLRPWWRCHKLHKLGQSLSQRSKVNVKVKCHDHVRHVYHLGHVPHVGHLHNISNGQYISSAIPIIYPRQTPLRMRYVTICYVSSIYKDKKVLQFGT